MNKSKTMLVFALAFPIIVLAVLTLIKRNIYTNGKEVILNIEAYDPRDLLSGHYLTYKINYDIDSVCPNKAYSDEAYVCFEPKGFSYTDPANCGKKIRGRCLNDHNFIANLERFYIPESRAIELSEKVRTQKASIVVAVMPEGHAIVKDLLIDGKGWKE